MNSAMYLLIIFQKHLQLLCAQSKVTEFVKDSTDDLWFLESATDDDVDDEKPISDGNVFANELGVVSDAEDAADTESDKDSILPDEVSIDPTSIVYSVWIQLITAPVQQISS